MTAAWPGQFGGGEEVQFQLLAQLPGGDLLGRADRALAARDVGEYVDAAEPLQRRGRLPGGRFRHAGGHGENGVGMLLFEVLEGVRSAGEHGFRQCSPEAA
ncbi:hypothetical protein ACFC18_35165 [Streptomyces sp. NPDC056121]|uniref:hypothetical protein n=1 Tax=unclassified Streptomyces TaxID=2593676 RepID=UPI0035DBCDDC